MRIKSVRIRAFGPFSERTLDLAPSMTVIVGDNEAGKSSWHAAIFAAVCGMRRGQGRRAEDREFIRRYRPWDGDSWSVASLIQLVDGREIEITHDLDGNVDCRAVDVGLGRRDVSSEIMFEGSPDASRWLGLDRRTFLATACVGQAEVLDVIKSADALQEHLQRAAATAGADATAARALALIEEFQREHVGLDRANSVRPLRRAIYAETSAESELRAAQVAHARYLSQLEALDRLDAETAVARRRFDVLDAASAVCRADEAEGVVERARILITELEGESIDLESVRAAAARVSAAIAAWGAAPSPKPLAGATSAELERELSALPDAPVGDLAPAASVTGAETRWRAARAALEAHAASEPASASEAPTSLSPSELRDLARDLAVSVPDVDPQLGQRYAELQRRLATTPERRANTPLLIAAAAVGAVGVGIGLFTTLIVAVLGLLVGAGLVVFGLRNAIGNARSHVLEELRDVEAQLGTSQLANEAARKKVDDATSRAGSAGVRPDPVTLTALAAEVERTATAVERRRQWEMAQAQHEQAIQSAEAALRAALIGRGIVEPGDLEASVTGYRDGSAVRARVAQQAARRPDLEGALETRRRAEVVAADAARRRQQAGQALGEAAREQRLEADDPSGALSALVQWEAANRERMEKARRQVSARAELDTLLAGRTYDELLREADQERRRAEAAMADLPLDGVETEAALPDLEARLSDARAKAQAAQVAAAVARGELKQLSAAPANVSECEEAFVAAQAELQRVRRLDATLTRTREFLERAQERVHRDIAPVLEQTLREWLPLVTAGRYTDASVDPESLEVKVKDGVGKFREAGLVSQGTREQIYLLLRVALVTHLTKPGEVSPLIFDDVTVQTDSIRTQAILDLFHEMSAERQVIIFSQEEDVRRWADANLDPARDRMVVLSEGVQADTTRTAQRPD